MFSSLFAAAVIMLACGLTARAQDVPSYARPDTAQETIRGRIIAVDGTFHLTLRDARGFIDDVQLRGNTVITPTGLTLSPGMDVTIVGSNGGNMFVADAIDTPYAYDGDAPPPVYYGDGWWYPGFAYGYGPAFSLGYAFGSPYAFARPFYGHPYAGGAYGPPPPNYGGHALRHTLGSGPAPRGSTAGGERRVYGATTTAPATHTDQVTPGNAHHAEPSVYTVAPAPAVHSSASTSHH